jgi:2,4-dienoyl-CoA reductase-like NADH-dependent reductase (Old Yellow Enzyme family)
MATVVDRASEDHPTGDDSAMQELFQETNINGMRLPNRFVRSATWEGLATPDGACTDRLSGVVERLAEGGVGLVITGHGYVSREGQAGPWQMGYHEDALLPGLEDLARAAHRHASRIAAQLAHAGAHAAVKLSGREALGPSPAAGKDGAPICREMRRPDIERVVRAFAEAAARARRAGFDAVQIHAAHGYLLSQFLSPAVNRRSDEYGGNLSNRSRIVLQVVRAAREAVGRDYPILVKLNSEDFLEGGFSVDEMLEVSSQLEREGVDAVELSGGTLNDASRYTPSRPGAIPREKEGYYRDAARRFKERVRLPLALVGGIRSREAAEQLVAEGVADYIALCRPLICEPDLVKRWRSGDRTPSACLSDNRCFRPAIAGEGLRCLLWDK